MIRSWNSYTPPVPVIVYTVFSRDSCRMCRCAWDSSAVATMRVGPVASARLMSACTAEGPTDEMKIFLMPTSGAPRSWKPHAPRSVAIAKSEASRLNNDIHQSSGHDDHLLRRLPRGELDHRLVGHRRRGDLVAAPRGDRKSVV